MLGGRPRSPLSILNLLSVKALRIREKEEDYGRERATCSHRVRARREADPPYLREGRRLADHHLGFGRYGRGLRPRREAGRGAGGHRGRTRGRPGGGLHLQERLLLGELHLPLPSAGAGEGRPHLYGDARGYARPRRLRQLLPALHRLGHSHPRRECARAASHEAHRRARFRRVRTDFLGAGHRRDRRAHGGFEGRLWS